MIERGSFLYGIGSGLVLLGLVAVESLCGQELQLPRFLYGSEDERYLSAENGELFFTMDGSDPKGADGKLASGASKAVPSTWNSRTLIEEGARYRFLVPEDGGVDRWWFLRDFDDRKWGASSHGIGYDEEDTYLSLIKTDVRGSMLGKQASLYMRWSFNLDEVPPISSEVDLEIRCDDGFVAYLNGKRVGAMNAPRVADWRSSAAGRVSDSSALKFETTRLIGAASLLRKGANVLALHGLNDKTSSSDLLFDVRLMTSTLKKGTVVWHPAKPTAVVARAYSEGRWSAPLRVTLPKPDRDPALGKDWAKFLGPRGDATYHGAPLLADWPDAGPNVIWRNSIGDGYASPVVSNGKLIVLHRPGRDLTVSCFDAVNGKELWEKAYKTTYRNKAGTDHGPRGTPTIHDGHVYFCNADGLLGCLRLADGEEVWKRSLKDDFDTDASWHGFLASPLVTATGVILSVRRMRPWWRLG